ncbi:MAG TPA: hypothetical protein VJB66_02175 [Candidatus Nanoarchaeia archaeon]|nr:hypothetical protein [Candidatus Nanoarchaeia archaeon]
MDTLLTVERTFKTPSDVVGFLNDFRLSESALHHYWIAFSGTLGHPERSNGIVVRYSGYNPHRRADASIDVQLRFIQPSDPFRKPKHHDDFSFSDVVPTFNPQYVEFFMNRDPVTLQLFWTDFLPPMFSQGYMLRDGNTRNKRSLRLYRADQIDVVITPETCDVKTTSDLAHVVNQLALKYETLSTHD